MEINGKKIQQKLLTSLKLKVESLKEKGITPGIAIVTLGEEETWEAYVGQKIKLANLLGLNVKLINLRPKLTDDVLAAISVLNEDNTIHGLIVQRPFPTYIDTERVIQSVSKEKDIDGFRKDSLFEVPVWLAVRYVISEASRLLDVQDLQFWLSNQSILVVGKGETGGMPVINGLRKIGITPNIIDSKTVDTQNLYEKADIVIFATGKRIQIPYDKLKSSSILIGIGLHRKNGQLAGDFDENEAKRYILYYTPSPRGIGPLNLYYLFDNLITAACLKT